MKQLMPLYLQDLAVSWEKIKRPVKRQKRRLIDAKRLILPHVDKERYTESNTGSVSIEERERVSVGWF